MPKTVCQKPGKPRLDPWERLLHRFYEPIVLLKIFDPTRGEQNIHARPDSTSDNPQDEWHKFLDHLAWVCDYELGGKTVSSIAVQTNPRAPIYWLAANTDPHTKAVPHLKWVLQQLASLCEDQPLDTEEVERRIASHCIEFSKKRVKSYSSHLCYLVQEATKFLSGQSSESDIELLDELQQLKQLRQNHLELCSKAYSFRNSSSLEVLSLKHSKATVPTQWSKLRHCIGRLGSWTKASKILVRVASSSPNLIVGFRIGFVVAPPPIAAPAADSKTNLDSALKRMFPANESARLAQTQETLRDFRVFDVGAAFLEEYTRDSFKPRIHAEVLLLEHFHHYGLEFIDNDKYIGCSKPSCYCCDLYMKSHPGNFVTRPCHGNLWINWRPPIPPNIDEKAARKHTTDILNEMVKRVRRDVIDQILSRQPRRPTVPDSTTGISASVAQPGMMPLTTSNLRMAQHSQTVNSPRAVAGNQQTLSSTVTAQGASKNDQGTFNMAGLEDELSMLQESSERSEDERVQVSDFSDDETIVFSGRRRELSVRDT